MKHRVRLAALLLIVVLSGFICSCVDTAMKAKISNTPEESYDVFTRSSYTSEQIYSYFTYLAVGSEYIDYDRVCRWNNEIKYSVDGSYNDEDIALIERLTGDLNRIDGFPGIYPADDGEDAALTISFVSRDKIKESFTYGSDRIEGITEYTASGDMCHIIKARIAIDCELEDRFRRSSAICEELVQSLGLGNDSMDYPDSIFYEGPCESDYPSELDFDMIRLLYSSYVCAGMNMDELCEAVAGAVGLDKSS